jgi:hypothetical protein
MTQIMNAATEHEQPICNGIAHLATNTAHRAEMAGFHKIMGDWIMSPHHATAAPPGRTVSGRHASASLCPRPEPRSRVSSVITREYNVSGDF